MAPSPSGDRWVRLEAIFLEAARLPPSDRPAFLDRHCAGDPDLRADGAYTKYVALEGPPPRRSTPRPRATVFATPAGCRIGSP